MKSITLSLLQSAANAFDFGGPVVCDARHYGEGHINDTFVVWREDHSKRFILQRINTDTFTDPVGLMENICGVTRHLREKILAAGGDPARETLNVIPTLSGAACHLDAEGGAWRAYDFVEDTICLQQVGSEADFRTVAETLGKFQNQLADYPASTLHETIARFHDTPNRYANFEKALSADALGRAKDIAPEVAFIHAREKDCHALLVLLAACTGASPHGPAVRRVRCGAGAQLALLEPRARRQGRGRYLCMADAVPARHRGAVLPCGRHCGAADRLPAAGCRIDRGAGRAGRLAAVRRRGRCDPAAQRRYHADPALAGPCADVPRRGAAVFPPKALIL